MGKEVGRAARGRVDVVFLGFNAQRGLDLVREAALMAATLGLKRSQLHEFEREAPALVIVEIHLHRDLVDVGHGVRPRV